MYLLQLEDSRFSLIFQGTLRQGRVAVTWSQLHRLDGDDLKYS